MKQKETKLKDPNDIISIPPMHEMQCIENIISLGPRGPHTKSDDKRMDTSNKQE